MAATMANENPDGIGTKRQHTELTDGDDRGNEEDEWIGPMPTEAVKEKKRKGNIPCIACGRNVITSREHWVECVTCTNGQHRACNTGISSTLYEEAMKSGCHIIWKCMNCSSNANIALSFVGLPCTQVLSESHDSQMEVAGEDVITTSVPTADISSDIIPIDGVSDAHVETVVTDEDSGPGLDSLQVQRVEETSDDACSKPSSSGREDVSYIVSFSQRQRPKLVDTRGYSYTIRRKSAAGTSWRCAVRNDTTLCYAAVMQTGDVFTFGAKEHIHEGKQDDHLIMELIARIKKKAVTEILRSPSAIVNDIIVNEVGPSGILPGLPTKSSLVRQANRYRQKMYPTEPKSLKFDLIVDFMPKDFIRGDVRVKGRRHIIMATNSQLMKLALADTWYIHKTDKLVKHPFTQLLSINCYAKKRKVTKLLPFCFVLMSRTRNKDYTEAFRVIKTLAGDGIKLSEIILDFDKSLWKSVSQVFDSASLLGYVHQWKQSVWSKIAKADLAWTYLKYSEVHGILSKLMSLAYLPSEVIPTTFQELQFLTDSVKVIKVFDHVSSTWLHNKLWPPETWSVYQHSVCSEADLEAWHPTGRNITKQSAYPFYKLVKLLSQKSQQVTPRIRLVSETKLKQYKGSDDQQFFFVLWEQYELGDMTAHQLLETCSKHYCQTPDKIS